MEKKVLVLSALLIAGFGAVVSVISLFMKARGKNTGTLWKKYLSWYFIMPPIVLPLVFSRLMFQVVVMLLSLLCFNEYSGKVGLKNDKRVLYSCYAAILSFYAPLFMGWYNLYQSMPVYAVAFLLTVPLQARRYKGMIRKTGSAVLGIIYFGWFFSHLAYLRNYSIGVGCIAFLLILVESNDAFGYLIGSVFGRHSLISRISPHKTVEGALGGLLSVSGMGASLGFLLPGVNIVYTVALSAVISLAGSCGDLVVSFVKRDLGIKDMGRIIPGHGGLLDRFDSIIFAAPLFFHFVRYIYGF